MAWPLPTELVAHGVWIWPEEASPLSPAWEVPRLPSAKHAALGETLWAANRGPGTRVSEHLLTCTEPASLRLASRRCLSEALSPARSSRFCFTSTSIWARSSRWVAAQRASCLLNSSRSPETSCCSRCAGKEQGPLSGARGRWARCTPIYTPRPASLQDCTPRPVPPGPSSPGPSILPTGLHSLDLQPQICTPLRLHSPGLHPSKAAPPGLCPAHQHILSPAVLWGAPGRCVRVRLSPTILWAAQFRLCQLVGPQVSPQHSEEGAEGRWAGRGCRLPPTAAWDPPSGQSSTACVMPTKLTHGQAMAVSAKLPRRTEWPHAGSPWWWRADTLTHRPSGRADGTVAGPATAGVLRSVSVGN